MDVVGEVQREVGRAAEALADARGTLVQVAATRWSGRAGALFADAVADEQRVLRMLDGRLDVLAATALHHAREAEAQHAAVVGNGL